MATSQKKSPSKRGPTVRDISVKRFKNESFEVHPLSGSTQQDEFKVTPVQDVQDDVNDIENQVEDALAQMDNGGQKDTFQSMGDMAPRDFVTVKFSKFVQLITSRDCADVVNANMDEDVVMSSNLLTELAGSHDEREEKKIPLVFLVGLAIGVVLTYILIMK